MDYGRNKNESERNKPLFGLTGTGGIVLPLSRLNELTTEADEV